MDQERRGHRRIRASLHLQYLDLEEQVEAIVTNLSQSGLFLPAREPLPIGRRIVVVISSPELPEPISVRGRVVRAAQPGDAGGPGMGVAFEEVPPRETARLKSLVASHAGRTVLVMSADENARADLLSLVRSSGYVVVGVEDTEALAAIDTAVSVVLVDATSCAEWVDVVAKVQSAAAWAAILIVASADQSDSIAARAAGMGVFGLVSKPFAVTELAAAIRAADAECDERRARHTGPARQPALVTKSSGMLKLAQEIESVATDGYPVLIEGETGAGKRLVAECLHTWSPRASEPFVVADCAAFNPNLRESELFGHEKGAFTGAVTRQIGRVERAGSGTLLLDEVDLLDDAMQVRLLRLLEEKSFERVGGSRTLRSSARIIAATNADLKSLVSAGRFRKDLYYRLAVVRLVVPPIRERHADLLELAYQLLTEVCAERSCPVPVIDQAVLEQMRRHPWPGNVRELKGALIRAVVNGDGDRLALLDLPASAMSPREAPSAEFFNLEPTPQVRSAFFSQTLETRIRQYRDHWLRQALIVAGERRAKAAKLCGMSASAFYEHIKRLGLTRSSKREPLATGHRILVVDDEPGALELLADGLRCTGYDVTTAASAREALRMIQAGQRFDFILADLLMPGMTGMELYRSLKNEDPALVEGDRFLLLTGHTWALADNGVTPGNPPVLEKPLDLDQVLAALSRSGPAT